MTLLLEQSVPEGVIAIRAPTDFRDFPKVPAYIALHGSTDGQVEALVVILLGE